MTAADIERAARLAAARKAAQAAFDLALPRRGTVNRRVTEWVRIDDNDYPLHTSPTRAPVPRVGDPQATESRVGEDAAR